MNKVCQDFSPTDKIVIKSVTDTIDTAGRPVEVEATLATVWGSVKYVSAKEDFEAMQEKAFTTCDVTIRFRSDVTEKMRLNFHDDDWDIRGIERIGRKRFLKLRVVNIDSGGN